MRPLSISSFNKHHKVIWVAGFLLVLFLFDRIGGYLLGKIVLRSNFRYSRLYSGELSNSIVIFGHSRAINTFYQPEIEKRIETDVVNLGFNGLPPVVESVLLSDYFRFNGPPKMIILEVSNGIVSTAGDWSVHLKPYNYFSEDLSQLVKKAEPLYHLKCTISHLYCFNNLLLMRIFYYLVKSDQSWINTKRIQPRMIAAIPKNRQKWEIEPHNLVAFKNMVDKANAENVPVKIVIGPLFPQLSEIIDLDTFKKIIESALNLRLRDYSRSIRNVEAFADPIHLNRYGSILLLDQMIKDGIFALPSGTDSYSNDIRGAN